MSSPPTTEERTLNDIINEVERFRILVIGRAGVGKSSLINRVFGLKPGQELAPVEDHVAGDAVIAREFVSEENKHFVLHDSKGFEPGQLENFEIVRKFVEERSKKPLLKDRIHGIWLCVGTPTAGGRVFETGDEKLLEFVYDKGVPLVLVFTQYDRLERTKKFQLRANEEIKESDRPERSKKDADKAFEDCLKSLRLKPGTPMPTYAKVSVRKGYEKLISSLVETTGRVAKERVKGDAWVLWSMAQRTNLPVKIKACIEKGIHYYLLALAGKLPTFGQWTLDDCLKKVHNDIITCWNFKDSNQGVLNSPEFQALMKSLVQDVITEPSDPSPPNVGLLSQISTVVGTFSTSLVPVLNAAGLAILSGQWLYVTLKQNLSEVQRVLIAYIVDLIEVLKRLFEKTITAELATTWPDLQAAFVEYEKSSARQSIHERIRSKNPMLTSDEIEKKVKQLLQVD